MLPKEVKSMSKQRKMTEKEKKERAKIREMLRKDGLIQPKKKPMNRKKFIDEARSVYESMDFLDNLPYLIWGISEIDVYKRQHHGFQFIQLNMEELFSQINLIHTLII